MEILASARKHGIADEDIVHAWKNAIHVQIQDYDNEWRAFVIGTDRAGRLIELVGIPAVRPQRIIHANVLQPKNYNFLR